ncbi:MAG: GNAT family N-acetyltransferase [Chitinophagaceae bacterium]
MHIQQEYDGNKGAFFVAEEGKRLAEMTYTLPGPEKMIIDHTEVKDVLRGKNVGYLLFETAIEYAKKNELKIIPLCPFASSVFKKRPELAYLLFTQNKN